MYSWLRVAVARVFALVMRCGIMRLVVYSRVGKNRDTRRGSPAGAGAGRTADHFTVLFSQIVLAVRKANCIYRPVSNRVLLIYNLFIVVPNNIKRGIPIKYEYQNTLESLLYSLT